MCTASPQIDTVKRQLGPMVSSTTHTILVGYHSIEHFQVAIIKCSVRISYSGLNSLQLVNIIREKLYRCNRVGLLHVVMPSYVMHIIMYCACSQ